MAQTASESLEREAESARKAGKFRESAIKFESAAAATTDALRRGKMELRSANARFLDRDVKGAREALKRAFSADPELSSYVPEFYSPDFQKEVDDVRRTWRPSPTPAPPDLSELKRVARAKLKDGLAEEVVYDLTGVPRDGLDAEALELLAQAYEKSGRAAEAANARRQASGQAPHPLATPPSTTTPVYPTPHAPAPTGPGAAADPAQLLLQGREALMRGDTLGARSAAYRTLEVQPSSSEAYRLLGDVFLTLGERVMAEANWRQAVRYDDRNEAAWLTIADYYLAEKSFDEALDALKRASAVNPIHVNRMLNLGRRARADKDLPRARQIFESATAATPGDVALQTEYAQVLLDIGDVDAALDPLMKAAGRGARNPVVRSNLAAVLRRKGQAKEAEREYQEAVAADGTYLPALLGLGILRLDEAPAEAVDPFRKAVAADPRSVEAVVGLARSLRLSGQPEEAAAALQASALDEAIVWNEAGVVAYQRQRYTEAVQLFDRALSKDPDLPELKSNRERAASASRFSAAFAPPPPPPPAAPAKPKT